MKVFVFDLDDTLLNRSKQIGPDTYSELTRRLQAGDNIILATSRPIRAVRYMLDDAFLQQVDIITLNGAIHHNPAGKMTRHAHLKDKARSLISHVNADNSVHYYIESDGNCFGTNAVYTDEELEIVHFATRDMVIPLASYDFTQVSKIALDGLGKVIDHHIPLIQNLGLKPIPCLDGTFLNVVDPACDKSTTLAQILNTRGIPVEDVVVFGDDIPDIEMMRLGGTSVAVSNAKAAVKQVADFIIGDCDEDGIGHFIRHYLSDIGAE